MSKHDHVISKLGALGMGFTTAPVILSEFLPSDKLCFKPAVNLVSAGGTRRARHAKRSFIHDLFLRDLKFHRNVKKILQIMPNAGILTTDRT